MINFFTRLLLGFILSIPITTILAGGVENAFGLLVISIVCTAGIGLVFWIPVWWLVGMLTLDVVVRLASGKPAPQPKPNPTKLAARDYGALQAFIAKAIAMGMDADEITQLLQKNGWPKADIESAYRSCISPSSQ